MDEKWKDINVFEFLRKVDYKNCFNEKKKIIEIFKIKYKKYVFD